MFNLKKEEDLYKLAIIGRFVAEELDEEFELNKYNIYTKYEDTYLYIEHKAFMYYPNDPIKNSLYIPFIYKKFRVKL